MSRRAVLAALAAAALLAASPVAGAMTSLALFTDTASATGNTVTGGSCASTTTFTSAVAGLATSGNREVWQRMTEQGGSPADDAFQGRQWTDSGAVFGTDGALYCSDDTALTLDGATDTASSDAQSYSTWGANGTVTVLLWIRGESTAAGRLVSLAEGASGGSTYAERVIWLTATGQIAIGSRYGSGSSSSFVTTTNGVDVLDGRWHLIAVVMPNTATTNSAPTILVDGSAAAATTTGTVTYRARSSSGTSARWYLGDNNAGRLPTGAPSTAWIGDYDEFVVVAGTPTATQLGSGAGSLYRAADS